MGTIMGDKAQPGTQSRDQARISPETSLPRFGWNVPGPQERSLGFYVPAASWLTLAAHCGVCGDVCVCPPHAIACEFLVISVGAH